MDQIRQVIWDQKYGRWFQVTLQIHTLIKFLNLLLKSG